MFWLEGEQQGNDDPRWLVAEGGVLAMEVDLGRLKVAFTNTSNGQRTEQFALPEHYLTKKVYVFAAIWDRGASVELMQ